MLLYPGSALPEMPLQQRPLLRKIHVSVKFASAIPGPEMAVPILWTPGKMRSFCRKKPMSIKFLLLGGGGIWGFFGGGSAYFIFVDARIFLTCPTFHQIAPCNKGPCPTFHQIAQESLACVMHLPLSSFSPKLDRNVMLRSRMNLFCEASGRENDNCHN